MPSKHFGQRRCKSTHSWFLAWDWSEWSASRLRKRSLWSRHWIGVWVILTGLKVLGSRKLSVLLGREAGYPSPARRALRHWDLVATCPAHPNIPCLMKRTVLYIKVPHYAFISSPLPLQLLASSPSSQTVSIKDFPTHKKTQNWRNETMTDCTELP
jgi:hypothetical protein